MKTPGKTGFVKTARKDGKTTVNRLSKIMKLSNLFASLSACAIAVSSFASPVMAQRPYIVSVPGKTAEGDTLKYDVTSLDNHRADYVNFTYYVISRTGDLRQNRGWTACGVRDGWLVTRSDGSTAWINVGSTASVNMLNSVCSRVFPHWRIK
ncbi:hypothetical protein [Nostoc phage N1]|nr:hypothetical protein [Nostoc phage N1]